MKTFHSWFSTWPTTARTLIYSISRARKLCQFFFNETQQCLKNAMKASPHTLKISENQRFPDVFMGLREAFMNFWVTAPYVKINFWGSILLYPGWRQMDYQDICTKGSIFGNWFCVLLVHLFHESHNICKLGRDDLKKVGKRGLEKSWEERAWKSVMYHHKKQRVESGLLDIF